MVILRYKIYETNVLGVQEPVISASIRQTEIETPIDLFGSIDEPTITPEPEFEVTFANGEADTQEEEIVNEEWQEEEEVEEIEESIQTFEEPIQEEVEEVEESILEEEEIEEPIQEEAVANQENISFEEETEAPTPWEPQFSADQPIWMAEMEANIRDSRSVFPLESLIGAFTLNEKLQFINELFEGSSDDFSTNIKQLDQLGSMDAARNMLAELAQTFNWDTESEIVEDFIYKICRRHATGA
jgi:hypothetical protein